LNFLHRFSKNT